MTMATDYRKRAEECIGIAQTARTAAQRTMLLHIAETWLNLARDADEDFFALTRGAPRPSRLH